MNQGGGVWQQRDSDVAIAQGPPRPPSGPPPSCGIVYAVIARQSRVLCECSLVPAGNYAGITLRLLIQLASSPDNSKMSYSHDGFIFHTFVLKGITTVCLADQSFSSLSCQAFLCDVHDRFLAEYATAVAAPITETTYLMSFAPFVQVLQERMVSYSRGTAEGADKVATVKRDLEDTRAALVNDIGKVLARGDSIEALVHKTSSLHMRAQTFRTRTRTVRRRKCCQYMCIWLVLPFVLLACASAVVLVILFKKGIISFGDHSQSFSSSE